MQANPLDAALDALSAYIVAAIPTLTVIDEWPDANQQLKYPSLTITTGVSTRIPLASPLAVSQTSPDASNQIQITEAVALYETTWQLDLWTRNKYERRSVQAALIALFQADEIANDLPDGIRIPMPDYYAQYVQFDLKDHEYRDDEQSAQRQERRAMLRVMVNCNEIRVKTRYAQKAIQVAVGVTENAVDDPTLSSETYTVP